MVDNIVYNVQLSVKDYYGKVYVKNVEYPLFR